MNLPPRHGLFARPSHLKARLESVRIFLETGTKYQPDLVLVISFLLLLLLSFSIRFLLYIVVPVLSTFLVAIVSFHLPRVPL